MKQSNKVLESTNFRSFKSDFPFLIGTPIFIGGFVILFYQIYVWLSAGFWPKMSLIYPLYNYWDWADYPASWFGLHKIIDGIPLSFGLIVLSFIIMISITKYSVEK